MDHSIEFFPLLLYLIIETILLLDMFGYLLDTYYYVKISKAAPKQFVNNSTGSKIKNSGPFT